MHMRIKFGCYRVLLSNALCSESGRTNSGMGTIITLEEIEQQTERNKGKFEIVEKKNNDKLCIHMRVH